MDSRGGNGANSSLLHTMTINVSCVDKLRWRLAKSDNWQFNQIFSWLVEPEWVDSFHAKDIWVSLAHSKVSFFAWGSVGENSYIGSTYMKGLVVSELVFPLQVRFKVC